MECCLKWSNEKHVHEKWDSIIFLNNPFFITALENISIDLSQSKIP